MSLREVYDKTEILIRAYEGGDLLGGNPMQHLEQFIHQKLKEQRELCSKVNFGVVRSPDNILIAREKIRNAPEPEF